MNKLKNRKDLLKLREEDKNAYEAQKRNIIVCGGTGCVAGGS